MCEKMSSEVRQCSFAPGMSGYLRERDILEVEEEEMGEMAMLGEHGLNRQQGCTGASHPAPARTCRQ